MEDPNKVAYFAQTNTRGRTTPFGIKRRDRVRHMYVIGKTGMGKSTLLENMAIQDIRNGEGMAFIDPHGSTADRIMEYVPSERVKDVVYFAPFDMEYPVGFNVMEDVGYDKRHLVVSGLLSAFRKIWVDAWSARMEYILSNTLLALLEYPDSTLLDVNRMLVDKVFRKNVVDNIQDPIVASFWKDEFASYSDRYTQEATPAIQNKIGQFTSNPLIRNIVGQPQSSFDIRRIMDEKKILIMNLSKGRVGEVNATLLGSMLVTKIYLAAMSRADVPASVLTALPNFYFYVDEFQSFANQSFADILSEARKYKLNLTIAHQYVEQMEEEVRDAVFGNVGTTIAFRVGPFDAETLETIFAPQFTKEDLVNLGFAQIYLTLMIDGVGSQPFSAETLPPFDPSPHNTAESAMAESRRQFGRRRQDVENAIAERQRPEPGSAPAPRRDAPQSPQHAEMRREQAKAAGDNIAGQHAVAASKALRDEHRGQVPQTPRIPKMHAPARPEHANAGALNPPSGSGHAVRPPGISSLKEAIERATRERGEASAPAIQPSEPARHVATPSSSQPIDLKAALRAIVPAAVPVPPAPQASAPEPMEPLPHIRPAGLSTSSLGTRSHIRSMARDLQASEASRAHALRQQNDSTETAVPSRLRGVIATRETSQTHDADSKARSLPVDELRSMLTVDSFDERTHDQ